MNYIKKCKLILISLLLLISWETFAVMPKKGHLLLANTEIEILGSYKIKHMLFPNEEWEFFIVIVPDYISQKSLINIAKDFYIKYPNTRARFFNDKKHIQQYIDRDRYVNDRTGRVPEVEFPNSEWVQNHHLGNINNRSQTHNRKWMLEDRYGTNISLLP